MSLPVVKLSARIDQGIKFINRVTNKWIDNDVDDNYVSVLLDLKNMLYEYRGDAFGLEDQIDELKESNSKVG